MKPLLLFATLLFFFWLASMAFAGGADVAIDPFNGCFAVASKHSDGRDLMADFVNKRGQYSQILDDSRKGIMTQCWEGKANCIRIPTVCRKDGSIVYEGFTWQSREVRK
jgi:hypothetical protein